MRINIVVGAEFIPRICPYCSRFKKRSYRSIRYCCRSGQIPRICPYCSRFKKRSYRVNEEFSGSVIR